MRKILMATTFALVAFAVTPASAAKMNCGGDGMAKANAAIGTMPIGSPQRWAADKQMVVANTAMSKGDMKGCNKALGAIQIKK